MDEIQGTISYIASARVPIEFESDPEQLFADTTGATALLWSPWIDASWELEDIGVAGEDVYCVETVFRHGRIRAQVAFPNVDMNLTSYVDGDLDPPIVVIEIPEPFSVKCQGLELGHLAHNQLIVANDERFPDPANQPVRGRFVFFTEYAGASSDEFATATTDQTRGDLFGARWTIRQWVEWHLDGGG